MADIAKNTHDLSLQVSGSTEYGFMLAKDGKGQRLWRVGDAPTLNPGYYSTDPTYANQPPLIEMVIPVDEWHVGYGLQDSARGGEKRYRTSYGADLRYKGKAFNGPATGTLTLPTDFVPTISNKTFEADFAASPNTGNWVKESGTATWARSAVQAQAGTYSGLMSGGTNALTTLVYQKLEYVPFKGVQLTFTCYVYQADASVASIGIADGVGTTWSSTSVTTGAWVQLTVAHTVDANATQLYLYLRNTDSDSALYFDTAAITLTTGSTATTGAYLRYIDFNSSLYLARGTSLLKYTGSGNWTYVGGTPNTITDLAVLQSAGESSARLFIAQGWSNFIWYSGIGDDANWFESTTANNKSNYLAEINGKLFMNQDMGGGDTNAFGLAHITTVNGAITGDNGNAAVGLKTTSNTGFVAGFDGLLYYMKTDQPYQLNSALSAVTAIMPEAISETAATSGKNAYSYKGSIYIPMGTQSLYRWGATTDIETLSPSRFAPGEADFGGLILALAGDSEWLFAVIDNSTKVELMCVREETIDGDTDWRWHPIAELTFSTCNHAWVSNVGSKRLWLCGATGDTPTFYYLPANYGDPTTDSTYSRNTSGVFYTPWYSGGFIDVNKAFFSASVLGDNLAAAKTITIAYQFPGDTDWTRTLTVFNAQETQYFATSDVAKKIRFKLTLASDSATTGAVLRGLIIRGALMPTKLRMFQFTVRAADGLEQRNGVMDKTLGSVLATVLKDCNSATWPVSLRDLDDTLYYVKFQSLDERVTAMDAGRRMERYFDVVATEAKLS